MCTLPATRFFKSEIQINPFECGSLNGKRLQNIFLCDPIKNIYMFCLLRNLTRRIARRVCACVKLIIHHHACAYYTSSLKIYASDYIDVHRSKIIRSLRRRLAINTRNDGDTRILLFKKLVHVHTIIVLYIYD